MPRQKYKRRADGRYQQRVTLSDGRTKLVYGRTEAELKEAARAALAEDSAGLEVGDRTLVGEWAKIWLQNYKADLRPSTVRMYRDAYNLHIMPVIGSMELRSVRPVHIRKVMAGVSDCSASLQHKVLLTAKQLFSTARQNRLLVGDPCEGIRTTPHARAEKKKYLTPQESETLMQLVTEPRARALCALCLYCGLRREEALALRWSDIGIAGLVVCRTVTFPTGNAPDLREETKSSASHRILPIPHRLRAILDETPRLGSFVVPTASGELMTYSAFKRLWAHHVQAVVPFAVHPHMLRHTYATSLYHAGIDLRTAQQLLGHATIQMTANIYTHLEGEDSLQAADLLNTYFAAAAIG